MSENVETGSLCEITCTQVRRWSPGLEASSVDLLGRSVICEREWRNSETAQTASTCNENYAFHCRWDVNLQPDELQHCHFVTFRSRWSYRRSKSKGNQNYKLDPNRTLTDCVGMWRFYEGTIYYFYSLINKVCGKRVLRDGTQTMISPGDACIERLCAHTGAHTGAAHIVILSTQYYNIKSNIVRAGEL